MGTLTTITRTVKQVVSEFTQKNVTFMAAGIAYNAFISLVPLLLLLLFFTSSFGGGLEERIVTLAQNMLPRPIADTVADVFRDSSGGATASAVGLVVLLWGTLKIFRGLDTAFSEIYETKKENSFVDQLVDGVVVLLSLIVAVLVTVAATSVFAMFSDVLPFVGALTTAVLLVGLLIAFLPIYYRFPDTNVDWNHVLPGVIFAALGWTALQVLFRMYISFGGKSTSGFFGGVILIITWLYFSGLVLLLGAVINAVLGGYTSGKAGGVGRGASGYETNREEAMNRDEFAEYLRGLREELTGHYEAIRPSSDAEDSRRHPRPTSEIEIIEQTSSDGGEQSIAFRWRTDDDESDGQSRPADD